MEKLFGSGQGKISEKIEEQIFGTDKMKTWMERRGGKRVWVLEIKKKHGKEWEKRAKRSEKGKKNFSGLRFLPEEKKKEKPVILVYGR